MPRVQVFLAALLLSPSAIAGELADKACVGVDSGSYTKYNQCADAKYQEAEADLRAYFSEVLESARNGPSSEEIASALNETQLAWVDFRGKTCELASWIEGYVYAPAKRSICMLQMTKRRLVELRELHLCIKSEGYGGDCAFSQ